MAACYFIDWVLLVPAGGRIDDCNHPVNTTYLAYLFDGIIVSLIRDEREQTVVIIPLIFLYEVPGTPT